MVLDDTAMAKLRNIQLEILKEYIRICKKHKLQYFLIGGSCLGAIRHQGYIPWDDDIDVAMPRDDYEKFLNIAQSELPAPYFLQTACTDRDYPLNFAKIRNSQTTFIESSVKNLNINHGVYFDIFPLDGYSKSLIFKIKRRLCRWSIEKVYWGRRRRYPMRQLIQISTYPIRDYHKARDLLGRIVKKYNYNDSDFVASYFGAWGEKEVFPQKIMGKGSVGRFEGLEVMLPKDPDGYCRQLYGDYWELPPVEKRVTHHQCEIIDLEKSYIHYVNNKG